jgi:hypothetical protein
MRYPGQFTEVLTAVAAIIKYLTAPARQLPLHPLTRFLLGASAAATIPAVQSALEDARLPAWMSQLGPTEFLVHLASFTILRMDHEWRSTCPPELVNLYLLTSACPQDFYLIEPNPLPAASLMEAYDTKYLLVPTSKSQADLGLNAPAALAYRFGSHPLSSALKRQESVPSVCTPHLSSVWEALRQTPSSAFVPLLEGKP